MSAPRTPYRVLPLETDDLPRLMTISQAAFAADTHTRMKMYEKGVEDLGSELEPLESIERQLQHPSMKMLKAVDEQGNMVGFSNWRMWNFDKDLSDVSPDAQALSLDAQVDNPDFPVLPSQTPLQQLQAITNGHMFGMMSRVNRPDTRTFFCVGISVHPDYQAKGVASALLEWATSFADQHNVQSWVHLSDHDGGVRAFEKRGFKVVNSVTVNLDKYATKHRGDEEPWGTYTFRFLHRMPRSGSLASSP